MVLGTFDFEWSSLAFLVKPDDNFLFMLCLVWEAAYICGQCGNVAAHQSCWLGVPHLLLLLRTLFPSPSSFPPSVHPLLHSFQCSFLNIFHFLSFIYPWDANCLLLHARPGTRLWAYEMLSDDTFTQEHPSLVMKTEQTWIDAIQVIMLCNDCIESPKEVRDFFKTHLWLRYWNLDIRIAWHSACHLSPSINVSLHFIFTKLIGSACFHDFQISFLQVIDGGWLSWLTCDYLVISNTHWTLVY